METVFLRVLNTGLTAGWLIAAVLFLRILLRKAPKWVYCLLWALVAFKLVCPFSIESALSLIPDSEPLPREIITDNTFQINTGIGAMDGPVNNYLEDHYYEGVSVPADNGNHVLYLAGIFWTAGIFLFALYGFVSCSRLYRLTRASVRLEDHIFQCDAVDTPFILGIVRPRIYLPSDMGKEQAVYVIAHERTHLKRGDHIWKPAGFLLLAVYWFQPLCWLSYILLCRDIELACDEHVIRSLGQESRKPYAEALLACSVKRDMMAACPLAFGEVGVKERVKNVLHYKKPALWIVLAAVVCCVAVAVCFLTSPAGKGEETSHTEETAEYAEDQYTEDVGVDEEGGQNFTETDSMGAVYDMLMRWQMAFCGRDAETMADMVTPELAAEMLTGSEGSYSFGVSSPWPWEEKDSYIYDYNEEGAVIYYYAMTSDPHVTCWRESLTYEREDDRYVITDEELTLYDYISTGEEFEEAYHGYLDGTMMDYTRNGLGENLNENALLSSSMAYRDLFEPESAAAFLLNLSKDPEDIRYTLHEPEGDGLIGLDITFLRDQTTHTISMLKPYGENGIWVPVDYRIDVVARFRKVPWEQVKNIRFTGDVTDMNSILCIGEIPERGIRVYGYNDEEAEFQGVAVAIGNDVNYFDWFYMSPRAVLPDLYWDEERSRLQISCHVYTGTGVSADELHVLQRYDTGTLSESRFGLEDYSTYLEERIAYHFKEGTRELVLTDTETKEELAAVAVPEEYGEKVTGVELGMISDFELGEKIYFHVSPGYYMDDKIGIAEYEDMLQFRFELLTEESGNGDVRFKLGECTVVH